MENELLGGQCSDSIQIKSQEQFDSLANVTTQIKKNTEMQHTITNSIKSDPWLYYTILPKY